MGRGRPEKIQANGKGVFHGYTGPAVADKAAQIVVEDQAHGTGSVSSAVEAAGELRSFYAAFSANAGYHFEGNFRQLAQAGVDA